MKTLRVLLVSVISFCLLNVQMIMTTQGLKVTSNVAYAQDNGDNGNNGGSNAAEGNNGNNGNSNAANGDNGSNGNTPNINSTNYQTTQNYSQQEATTEGHGWMEQITMLAIGFIVAGWFMKCSQPLPADMIIAAVGAGILIIGEIVAITMYQGTAAKMEMAYQADHEGKMLNNDDQVEAFRKELQNNEEILDALETKLMLQIAAEVAFGAAMALAITLSIVFYTMGALCVAGAALVACPGPCQVQCGATATLAAQMMARDLVPSVSTVEYAEKRATAEGTSACSMCVGLARFASNQYFSGCVSVAQFNPGGFPEKMIAKIQEEKPEMARVAQLLANDYNKAHFSDDPEVSKEANRELIEETLLENGYAKMQTAEFNPFPVKLQAKSDDHFNHYIRTYEANQFRNGQIKSISLDQYNTFNELYGYKEMTGSNYDAMKEMFIVAAEKGIDLFLPAAEANFGKILTIVGGALLAVVLATSTVMDMMLGTGIKRSITYAGFVAAVAMGIMATNEDIEATEQNIDKLNEILNNLSDLNGGPMVTHTGAPTGSGAGGGLDRPQIQPSDQDITLGLDNDAPTPCLGGGTPGNCNDVEKQFKAASAIDGLTLDSGLNSTANTVAGIGNDLSGTRSLSGNTLGKLRNLGKNKGALNKVNRGLKDKLAEQLKKNKLNGLDIDKEGNKFLGDLQKAMLKKMQQDGITGGQLLASAGVPSFGKDKNKGKDDKALNDAKQALAAAKGKDAGKAKAKAAKIGFDFGDNKAGAAANQAAMDDPNVIGADEEYVLDDIVDDKGASLWQIISVRYLKSGYNRLRGENKTPQKISE
ncbi:MAG: hypothetical protein EP326_10365 [Deltaproteobacteria bacterium]|nr:MAG: hypothetical protein EP326_10365 [Deltaproteobacteria bacterium]TNF28808.1 MAG: hypothetical protein EP319_08175 [Deltaproteobacteria bacterium]